MVSERLHIIDSMMKLTLFFSPFITAGADQPAFPVVVQTNTREQAEKVFELQTLVEKHPGMDHLRTRVMAYSWYSNLPKTEKFGDIILVSGNGRHGV